MEVLVSTPILLDTSDRGHGGGQRVHGGRASARVPARGLDPDRVRSGGRDRRLGQFTGNTIGSFVGLVPSEFSSGRSRVQGPITKAGNTHVRRLLVESAWHHKARYAPGKAGPAARVRGDEGNRRLHARWVRFTERRKRHVVANVAIARELAGWCWSLAVMKE
ncbi:MULTISPECIES: transposase [Aeromicrobium]|uniref:transposase n=1 Tax=Aeromicrobium TaxID=2040 RepID=UPI00257C07C3|nr:MULTISPECIES: transposase [Aeromicrobium]